MMNPLFFHFCLWFLYSDQKYLAFENRDQVCDDFVNYCFERFVSPNLVHNELVQSFPTIDIEGAVRDKNKLNLNLHKTVAIQI